MKNVFERGTNEDVKKVLADQKALVQAAKAAKKKTTGKSEDEKASAQAAFVIEKKKLKELQLTLKMVRDQEAQRVRDAKAAAQAAIDAAKAVKLDAKVKVALL
jgi:hypothetical protein